MQYFRRGILSTDPKENPEFHNFNIALIAYCDGAARLGTRGKVQYGNRTLSFDGRSNLQQVLQGTVRRHSSVRQRQSGVRATGACHPPSTDLCSHLLPSSSPLFHTLYPPFTHLFPRLPHL